MGKIGFVFGAALMTSLGYAGLKHHQAGVAHEKMGAGRDTSEAAMLTYDLAGLKNEPQIAKISSDGKYHLNGKAHKLILTDTLPITVDASGYKGADGATLFAAKNSTVVLKVGQTEAKIAPGVSVAEVIGTDADDLIIAEGKVKVDGGKGKNTYSIHGEGVEISDYEGNATIRLAPHSSASLTGYKDNDAIVVKGATAADFEHKNGNTIVELKTPQGKTSITLTDVSADPRKIHVYTESFSQEATPLAVEPTTVQKAQDAVRGVKAFFSSPSEDAPVKSHTPVAPKGHSPKKQR